MLVSTRAFFGLTAIGLDPNERRLCEHLFAKGVIQILVATSTLAWGVNLPARLVVMKVPMEPIALTSIVGNRVLRRKALSLRRYAYYRCPPDDWQSRKAPVRYGGGGLCLHPRMQKAVLPTLLVRFAYVGEC